MCPDAFGIASDCDCRYAFFMALASIYELKLSRVYRCTRELCEFLQQLMRSPMPQGNAAFAISETHPKPE